ncbi:MAG: glycosyltransferase [Bacilli bacterium]
MKKNVDVSVIVTTYNPNFEKFLLTLDSIINQKDINFEIIISDDGSKENYFKEIKNYMLEKNFNNYILIENKNNQGTVLNVYEGIKKANGQYIKCISPGDEFNGDNILSLWVNSLKKSGKKWSFSDSIYYYLNNDQKKSVVVDAHPRVLKYFKNGNNKKCIMTYVVYSDLALGAAVLCEKDIFEKYLKRIINKIKYCEDYVYRLLMFDGHIGYYFEKNAILYEYGTGISTKKDDKWSKRIYEDYNNLNDILESQKNLTDFQKKMVKMIHNRRTKKFSISYFFNPVGLYFFFKLFISKRKTNNKGWSQ